ncbi:MAG TPA: hypothetical protein VOA41_00435 [Candidatus Dormibacteraeota bacterium]|nr:hypothetical protein [Candidatus Dormibacteraeota bacterium]
MHPRLGLLFLLGTSTFLVACSGLSGGPSTPPPPTTVTIAPTSASVALGQSVQFTATVVGATSPAVTWQVNSVTGGNSSVGTTSGNGLYTAPAQLPNPATVTVTAVSSADPTKRASASVTITAASTSISVTPSSVRVLVFGTVQFTAMVNGSPSTAVTWQVNGVTGGASKTGAISSGGLYTAPNAVPVSSTPQHNSKTTTVTVQAISQADPGASGSAVITVTTPNQNALNLPLLLGGSGGNAGDSSTSGTTTTCCGGTLGALVSRGAAQYILSNNHILARLGLAAVGDPIIQPGLIDANCSAGAATTIAKLTQFVNFDNPPSGKPLADAAIAEVVPGTVDPTGTILQLGASNTGTLPTDGAPHAGSGVSPTLGLAVAKSGRSTGLTCSRIESINVAISVEYQKGCGTGATITKDFTNQVQIAGGEFSAQGDSGSLIVTQDTADPVALLYAGSDTDTVGNPIGDVLNALADPATGEKPVFVGTPSPHPVAACSLPGPSAASAAATATAHTASFADEQRADQVREQNAPRLLSHPEVQAVGTGSSIDAPGRPAILLFVTKGQSRADLPAEVDGIRTRIVEGQVFAHRGNLNADESARMVRDAERPLRVTQLPIVKVSEARQVEDQHLNDLMNLPGVQGVGVTASADSPGDAAVILFVVRGSDPRPIPATIGGVRTRIRESSRFQAGFSDAQTSASSCSAISPKALPHTKAGPSLPQPQR